MENKTEIMMAVRNNVSNDKVSDGTIPVSIALFELIPEYVKYEDDDDLRVSFYKVDRSGVISGALAVPNQSHDLYCIGGDGIDVIRNDQPVLLITHMSSNLPCSAVKLLPETCANIYGVMPSSIVDLSTVIDEEEKQE